MWGEGFKKPKMKQKIWENRNGHGSNGDWKCSKTRIWFDT